MIKFDSQGLTIHDKLDKTEAFIFCKFLLAEKKRHAEDIRMIESSIDYLENKFSFKADERR
jgi:hypothetical protein